MNSHINLGSTIYSNLGLIMHFQDVMNSHVNMGSIIYFNLGLMIHFQDVMNSHINMGLTNMVRNVSNYRHNPTQHNLELTLDWDPFFTDVP